MKRMAIFLSATFMLTFSSASYCDWTAVAPINGLRISAGGVTWGVFKLSGVDNNLKCGTKNFYVDQELDTDHQRRLLSMLLAAQASGMRVSLHQNSTACPGGGVGAYIDGLRFYR